MANTGSTNPSRLDPSTAYVTFTYEDLTGGEEEWGPCVGRVYYWYAPGSGEPAVTDHALRSQHPEITDDQWDRLSYEAFDRGETAFEENYPATLCHSPSDVQRDVLSIGRLFGPRPPRTPSDSELADGGRPHK